MNYEEVIRQLQEILDKANALPKIELESKFITDQEYDQINDLTTSIIGVMEDMRQANSDIFYKYLLDPWW